MWTKKWDVQIVCFPSSLHDSDLMPGYLVHMLFEYFMGLYHFILFESLHKLCWLAVDVVCITTYILPLFCKKKYQSEQIIQFHNTAFTELLKLFFFIRLCFSFKPKANPGFMQFSKLLDFKIIYKSLTFRCRRSSLLTILRVVFYIFFRPKSLRLEL